MPTALLVVALIPGTEDYEKVKPPFGRCFLFLFIKNGMEMDRVEGLLGQPDIRAHLKCRHLEEFICYESWYYVGMERRVVFKLITIPGDKLLKGGIVFQIGPH